MEDVQSTSLTPPTDSGISQQQINNNDMQQDNANAGSSSLVRQHWKTVEKKRNFRIAMPIVHLPGETDIDKKNYAYNMINKFPELTSINVTKIKDSRVVTASFSTEAAAQQACLIKISGENDKCFAPYSKVFSAQPSATFFIKVIDVPLDVDKPIFQQYLNKYGKVDNIKYQIRDLYYNVLVTYAEKSPAALFKDVWCLNFGKLSFRCFPEGLLYEDRQLRSKFGIKLANLPKGCTVVDLQNVLREVDAKTCFIPKKRDNQLYQRERFTFIQFNSQQALDHAQTTSYVLNGRALQWTPCSTRTCRECGSIHHLVRSCKEANRKHNVVV